MDDAARVPTQILSLRLREEGTVLEIELYMNDDKYYLFGSDLKSQWNHARKCLVSIDEDFSEVVRDIRLTGAAISSEVRGSDGNWQLLGFVVFLTDRSIAGQYLRRKYGYWSPRHSDMNFRQTVSARPNLYRPLRCSATSIRLLRIGTDNWESVIQCSMEERPVDATEKYCCLSYTWGDDTDIDFICVNGIKVEVRRNLFNALRRLRWHGITNPLWVDALCIDQVNEAEKAQQVSHMADIFAGAKETIVWIGEEPPSNYTSTFLQGSRYLLLGDILRAAADDQHLADFPPLCTYGGTAEYYHNLMNALISAMRVFAASPWFQRTWTVQEMVLQPEACVLFGCEMVSWQTLSTAIENIYKHRQSCCAKLDHGVIPYLLDACVPLRAFIEDFSSVRSQQNRPAYAVPTAQKNWDHILDVLNTCRNRLASDPRDKVYGLLGCLSSFSCPVHPDYSRSTRDVYQGLTLKAIEETRSCDIWDWNLCRQSTDRVLDLAEMPSWILDWDWGDEGGILLDPRAARLSSWRRWWMPSRFAPSCVTTSPKLMEHDVLALPGQIIDRIEKVIDIRLQDDSAWARLQQIRGALMDQVSGSTYPFTKEPLEDAFWRTMTTDYLAEDPAKPRRLQDADRELRDAWINEQEAHDDDHIWLLTKGVDHVIPQTISIATFGRRLFISAKGYIGLAPYVVCPGDELFILSGCSSPYALRPRTLTGEGIEPRPVHSLVGCAYIHGLMEGEAAHLLDEAKTVSLR